MATTVPFLSNITGPVPEPELVGVLNNLINQINASTPFSRLPLATFYVPPPTGIDDTASINNVISTANSMGGGTVTFLPGTYMVNAVATPTFGAHGITLLSNVNVCIPSGTTLQALTTSQDTSSILFGFNVSNIVIYGGGTINGDRATHTGGGTGHGMGIHIESGTNISITDVICSNCWGDGIYIGSGGVSLVASTNINISGVTCFNNNRNNMSLINVQGVTVVGNVFSTANGLAPEAGIDLEPDPSCTISDVTITGNVFLSNHTAGIQILDTNGAISRVTITGNVFDSNVSYGLIVNAPQVVINSNQFFANAYGIYLTGADAVNCLVVGNMIRQSTGSQAGIWLAASASTNQFLDNTIQAVTTGQYGIVVIDSSMVENTFVNTTFVGSFGTARISDSGTRTQWAKQLGSYPVASLPTPGNTAGNPKGYRAFATDANATLAAGIGGTVAAGGANFVPLYSDGTNWKIG